jgi:Pentapeptide repeats (9 copies)
MSPEAYDWDLERDAGPHRRFVAGVALTRKLSAGEIFFVRRATFRECDFQGGFRGDPILMFEDCQFINCDFAYSSWTGAHFKQCKFSDSSLSLASFQRCEFRDCEWERLGVASRTEFVTTFVSHPGSFIRATVSRTNPKDTSAKHKAHQAYRLSGTRAHVLRSLMLSHAAVGDEHIYYKTVRLHELQRCSARIAQDIFELVHGKLSRKFLAVLRLPFNGLDYLLMRLLGLTNAWGDSVSRPCALLTGVFAAFGVIYALVPFETDIARPFQKSFDITLLVGYGNQVAAADTHLSLVQDVHAGAAIILYTVFLSTMISKLSRAR